MPTLKILDHSEIPSTPAIANAGQSHLAPERSVWSYPPPGQTDPTDPADLPELPKLPNPRNPTEPTAID